jgi:hypothetical protein
MSKDQKIKILTKALKFYARKSTWEETTSWTGGGFSTGEEPDNRQPYSHPAVAEEDAGDRARKALKKLEKKK